MTEKWIPCPGYETTHLISNHGRVMSQERDVASCYGSTIRRKARLMKLDTSSQYARIQLRARGPKLSVHRLVAEAFIGPAPDANTQVNHIDGKKTNNRDTNLEWVSCSENIRHSFANGLSINKKGPDNPLSKPLYLYNEGKLLRSFASTRCASEFFGTSMKTIDNHLRSFGGRYKGFVLTREAMTPLP